MTQFFKKSITALFLFAVLISLQLLFSCNKEKHEIIKANWQVESLKIDATSPSIYPAKSNVLSFKGQSKCFLKLDANDCGSGVDFRRHNEIHFQPFGCTLVEGESTFTETLVNLLEKANHYSENGTTLILTGDNGMIINLKKQ